MNDRERYSRSLAVRQSGWLCAGLAAATGLYSFCPSSMLGAAGIPTGSSSENVSGQSDVDSAETERVERALFEADPDAPPASAIRRIAVWPLKKKPATASTKSTRPKLLPWASDVERDPFAEADEAAQKKILAEKSPSPSELAGETGFAKSTSNRRRLLEFQAKSTGTKVAVDKPAGDADVAGTVTLHEVTESTTEFDVNQPAAATTPPGVEGDSEAQLRAMYEDNSAADEPAGRATVRAASKATAQAKEESAAVPRTKSTSTSEIRQVSEADASEEAALEPASDNTPLPVEALLYRAQKGQARQARVASQPLKLADDQGEAPASEAALSTAESDIPQSTEPQESASDSASELQTAESPAEPQPTEADEPVRVKVDQVPMTSKSASLSMKVVPPKRAPATIPEPRPVENRQAESAGHPIAEPAESIEPVIRPAPKTDLPPEQVLANRPIELPAPEGWSAAVKLNARRAARLAELTARKPAETAWPAAGDSASKTRPAAELENQSPGVEQQSYRVDSTRQPVALDKIEEGRGVRVLAAEDTDLEPIRDAHHLAEPQSVNQEPAMIGESAAEPIVVAEYAAHGQSVWWMRLFTVIGVLFGLYGMWCCRIRPTDAD